MKEQPRTVLVTGSTGGLGHALASTLAGLGHSVMLHGLLEPAAGQRLADELGRRHKVSVAYTRADLTAPDEIGELIERTRQLVGEVDILVNNAVARHFAPIEELEPPQWETALAVNLSAPFHAIRQCIGSMRKRDWGRIINLVSPYSFKGIAGRVDYTTTKAGLMGMTRTVALEVAGTGITCNAVCPGTVRSPNIAGRIADMAAELGIDEEEAARRYLAARQPSGRFISEDSVGAMVELLCSSRGLDINGAVLPVDGAFTAM